MEAHIYEDSIFIFKLIVMELVRDAQQYGRSGAGYDGPLQKIISFWNLVNK
ncbi:MAG: hypothetical protein N3G21_07925 [Candidatus Hydrogenedentes bacterium]|nr:hypothetical protein [Candidatus Hydrogenedentota bacterium]